MGQTLVIYLYVENYYTIPESWSKNLNEICTNARKTETFHHMNMSTAGYYALLPVYYFWKAFENSDFGKKFYYDSSKL